MQLKSRAKINLFLNVCGKNQSTGYHYLESLAAFADDVYDGIELLPSQENTIYIAESEFSNKISSESNIIHKAFCYASEKYSVLLTKNIPVSAGLGGGSSNVACLISYFSEHKSPANLIEECFSIGADVPVCLLQKSSYFSGYGEILEPIIEFPEIYAVLVNPKIELPTKQVFNNFNKEYTKKILVRPNSFVTVEDLVSFIKINNNDLQDAAINIIPEIKEIITEIENTRNCMLARMSGSGATCFGLYKSLEEATQAETELEGLSRDWWIKKTKII